MPDLSSPVSKFEDEAKQILDIFARATNRTAVHAYALPYTPMDDGCVVSLWDAWNRFLRDLVLTSASGACTGLGGSTYVPAVARSESDAMQRLSSAARSFGIRLVNGEPNWYNLSMLASCAAALGLQNDQVLVSALSSTTIRLGQVSVPSPLEEVRLCRNYIAHKSTGTRRGVEGIIHPTVFAGISDHCRRLRYGVETFQEWGEGMISLAYAASQ